MSDKSGAFHRSRARSQSRGTRLALEAFVQRLLRISLGFCVAGVSLLQQSRACRAAETTQQGVTASAFASDGEMMDSQSGSSADVFDVARVGMGAVAVLRVRERSDPPPGASQHGLGFFALAGAAAELESTKQTWCEEGCNIGDGRQGPVSQPHELAFKVGARLGVGYSFSLVEFRLGGLFVLPSSDSVFPDRMWSPDVLIRVGPRRLGWFELGLGAYDASTMLRPGAYLGGGGGNVETLRVTGHVGIHLVNGLCCRTSMPFGVMAALDVERAVSPTVIVGVDARIAAMEERLALGGGFHLAFLL